MDGDWRPVRLAGTVRRYLLRLFGYEVASWEIENDSVETLAEAISGLVDGDAAPSRCEAGATHDFERDQAPLDPNDRYEPYDDRRRFGFRM